MRQQRHPRGRPRRSALGVFQVLQPHPQAPTHLDCRAFMLTPRCIGPNPPSLDCVDDTTLLADRIAHRGTAATLLLPETSRFNAQQSWHFTRETSYRTEEKARAFALHARERGSSCGCQAT